MNRIIRRFVILTLAALACAALSRGQDADGSDHGSDGILQKSTPTDLNRDIYYGNKLEFSLETGWLPINIPFIFDCFVGDEYNRTPLNYMLVPMLASLRWHLGGVRGPGVVRGNCDLMFSLALTVIPRGPETHYVAYDMGIRRNFVQRNWRIAPYYDTRLGVGRMTPRNP